MPLPAGPPTHGAPEFEALRQALRELATALDQARDKELEAERLRAFREVARRVAHEIKNPLTAMRIAVDQLRRSGGPVERRTDVADRRSWSTSTRLNSSHTVISYAVFCLKKKNSKLHPTFGARSGKNRR